MSDWIAYDRETGEVREDAKIRLPEDIRKQNKWVGYKNICDMKASVDKSYFKFFISQFENITDLKPQTLARLMYLSTYISYDNNYLKHNNGVMLDKKSMKNLMKLSERTFDNFYKEVIDKGYLIQDNGYRISKKIIHKGSGNERQLSEQERYNKIYINAMQKMYLSTKINQHKLLGYVFMMLPYVNIKYNILCYNPFENVMDFIIPITMNNFCDYIGVGTEQVNRFRKNIENIIFTFNGREQHFLCFILSANVENKNHGMIMINPNILYGRNIIEREGMIELFYRHDTNKRINTKLEVGGSNE